MKKILFSLLIIISLFATVSCSDKTNNATEPSKDNTNTTDNVAENNEDIGFKQGNLAPDFEVELLTGEKVKLSDYRDKIVLLNFWATWCPPCVNEMPDMQKLQDDFGDEFVILAISLGEERSILEEFQNVNDYTFKIGFDEKGVTGYPVRAFPTTFLLNREGAIEKVLEGSRPYDFYAPLIEELLKK